MPNLKSYPTIRQVLKQLSSPPLSQLMWSLFQSATASIYVSTPSFCEFTLHSLEIILEGTGLVGLTNYYPAIGQSPLHLAWAGCFMLSPSQVALHRDTVRYYFTKHWPGCFLLLKTKTKQKLTAVAF